MCWDSAAARGRWHGAHEGARLEMCLHLRPELLSTLCHAAQAAASIQRRRTIDYRPITTGHSLLDSVVKYCPGDIVRDLLLARPPHNVTLTEECLSYVRLACVRPSRKIVNRIPWKNVRRIFTELAQTTHYWPEMKAANLGSERSKVKATVE